MVIVDTALQRRESEGRPVRVAVVGAGYMGRGIVLQILTGIPGMTVVAVANRTLSEARRAYSQGGVEAVAMVSTVSELENAIANGRFSVTDDPELVCRADGIDAVLEATGEVDLGAQISLDAIRHGKHVVLMNAELDATVGPILKVYADQAGVVLSNSDGDEPGVAMNLYRFIDTIGYRPVMAGNIKGFIDHYRTPDTQRAFAEKNRQKPKMITSFADGTKLSMECTVLSNATGFGVKMRGMEGFDVDHVNDVLGVLEPDELVAAGRIDYVLGAKPGTGAFVVGYNDEPAKKQYMQYFKMGDGPLYLFYTPFHLPHLQVPLTIARAVLFSDAAVTPIGAPVSDVVACAKRDLNAGEELDGIGGFTCYGAIDDAELAVANNWLPMGLADRRRLARDVAKDQVIQLSDLESRPENLLDRLRREQTERFFESIPRVMGQAS
ncbi:MAG: NAD(P)-dependent oxidoreductase [Rhodothermales bacterium]|nr:NAD(P)-dependent oxidoreductase [Rhodothermales bacterium]